MSPILLLGNAAAPHRFRMSFEPLLPYLNLLAILLIIYVDWITPAGVVVGISLSIPIIASSLLPNRRHIYLATGVATIGYVVQAIFGAGPISPAQVWVPNRIMAFLSVPAAGALSLLLHRLRTNAEAARDEAREQSELNRILMSLLAHDLRTPLTLALQGLEYAGNRSGTSEPLNAELLEQLQARLRRSLRSIEVVLSVSREDERTSSWGRRSGVPLALIGPELAAEVESYSAEARAQGKGIVLDFEDFNRQPLRVNALVLRQALGILLENAIRHAVEGRIDVTAQVENAELVMRVRDQGPGLSSTLAAGGGPKRGSGLGLRLLDALIVRAGGLCEVESDTPHGTCFALHLPLDRERLPNAAVV